MLAETLASLHQTDTWFWNQEPRVVINLIDERKRIDKENMKAQGAYIACLIWGHDVSEFEDEKPSESIPGIDVPVNPEVLNCFHF